MPKVFITNKSSHDFSAAEHFGDFIYLSKGRVNRYATNQMYRLFMEALRESQPTDYLLPTGLSTMNLIAATIFALKHGRLNLLLFKDGRYIERVVVFDLEDIAFSDLSNVLTNEGARALLDE